MASKVSGHRRLAAIDAFADHEHAAGVAVPAVLDDRDIDVDRCRLFQRLVVRDAVADLLVDRGAQRFGVGFGFKQRLLGWQVEYFRCSRQHGGDDQAADHLQCRRGHILIYTQAPKVLGHFAGEVAYLIADGHAQDAAAT
jgi:GNAT superfamily N-acetyltransferase